MNEDSGSRNPSGRCDLDNGLRRPWGGRRVLSLALAAFVIGIAGTATAAVLTVPVPYATIQSAINAAASGDTINVAAGTYPEQLIIGKGLTIVGDELNPDNVVIDGQNAALPLYNAQVRISDATGPVVFKGFRIINTGTKSGEYFGIYAKGVQPVTVQNCKVIGHGATVPLGDDYGIWANAGTGALVISGSYFADLYHAILLERRYGTSTLENNTFDALFTGMYVDGNIYGGRAIEAIVYGTTDVTALQTIRGNQFLNFRSTGVQFSGGFSGQTPRKFTNVLIENNNFDFQTTDIVNLNGAILLQNISTPANDNPAGGVTAEVRNNFVRVPSGNGIIVKGLNGTINIHDNSISGNLTNGVKADQSLGTIVKATGNWWGDASGPTHAGNPGGTGDAVTDNVDYSPWWEADYLAPDKTLLAHPWSWGVNTSNSSTIQEGINAATAGDTVNVRAGTYNEQVTIAKALTVSGADGAVLDGTGLAPTWTTGVKIRSGNVTFNNIDVTDYTQDGITAYDNIDMPNLHITNLKVSNIQPGYWGFGIYVGYESEGWGYNPPDLTQHLDFSGLLIEGNEIVNTHSSGLVLQAITGTPGTLVVRDNYIHDITLNDAVWVDCARELTIENNIMADSRWGIEFSCIAEEWYLPDGPYSPKNIDLQCNQITGNTDFGVGWWNGWLSTISFESNSIQGNASGAENYVSAGAGLATGNWWGCTGGPGASGCDTVSGSVDFSGWLTAAPACVTCLDDSDCDDKLYCDGAETCATGSCTASSGDPCVGGSECADACNESADNCNDIAGTACSTDSNVCTVDECDGAGTCAHDPGNAGTECRGSAGICDVAETCTGNSAMCPADGFQSGTECRASAGDCDVAESCTGSSALCPADALQPSSFECRASGGVCDVAENCTGSSTLCPADGFKASSIECRAVAGGCDVAENCTGSSALCPQDGFQPSSLECRASAGVCDIAENCTGSAASCPANAFEPASTICRIDAGDCDVAEACTGNSAPCPSDAFEPSETVCTDDGDPCTRNRCDGSGVCAHPPIVMAETCNWAVVGGTSSSAGKARTRTEATVTGDVCADRADIGEETVTAGDLSWVATQTSGTAAKVRPFALLTSGDLVTGGGCVRGLNGGLILDTEYEEICCAEGSISLSGGGEINACGASPLVDDCATAKGQVSTDALVLQSLVATQTLDALDCSPASPCTISATGAMNVVDIDRIKVRDDGVLTIDALGNPDAVFILRVAGRIRGNLRSMVELAGGAQAKNVLFYAVHGTCRFGNETVGAGTLFCPGGKVRLPFRSEWNGAAAGGDGVDIGEYSVLTHVPFLGLAD